MKVLYLITKSNWGGAQRYVYDLATHLPENYEAVAAAKDRGLLVEKLSSAGIKFVSVSYFGIFRLIHQERPDIVHANSSVFGGLGSFFAWLLGVPKIVFTAHGWPFNEDRNLIWRLIVYKLSWLTSLFSTITQKDYKQGKRMWFVGHKIRFIHNAIGQIDFIDREIARQKLGLGTNDLVVGTIGELHKNKGFIYLERASEELREVKFVVIGEGEERPILSLTRLNLFGFVPDAGRYLRAFDIFVDPSVKCGLQYVLLEAAQAGLPVVASDVGGNPDVIGDAGMLVPSKNPELLTRAINDLISNPKLRNDLGTQLGNRVSRLFNFQNFLSQTYELYRN